MIEEVLGKVVNSFADGRIRNDDREDSGTQSREQGFGIFARVMRFMHNRIS